MSATKTRAAANRERRRQRDVVTRALEALLALSPIPGEVHKRAPLRELFCRAGRHDYELLKVDGPRSVTLECFYCGARKGTSRT